MDLLEKLIMAILQYCQDWDSTEEGYNPAGFIHEEKIPDCAEKIAYILEIDKEPIIEIMKKYIKEGWYINDFESITDEIWKYKEKNN